MEQGFYKLDGSNLNFTSNSVLSNEYILIAEDKDTYTYPIDGWYWFNSLSEAKIFFKIN